MSYELSHLRVLESEAIHIMREVAAELERPVLLFSGGKDSIVLLRLAEKAFRPGGFPFPLMHVDTGHNFPEVHRVPRPPRRRARRAADRRAACRSRSTTAASSRRPARAPRATGCRRRRCSTRSSEHGFDAAFGGARRDEERARAKERIFSFRDEFGQWDPKSQRPELWNLYNGRIQQGRAHARLPDLELDRARRLAVHPRGALEIPSIYFAHEREVFRRDGMLYANSEFVELIDGEEPFSAERPLPHRRRHELHRRRRVRRAARSTTVVAEIAATRITERGETRADDRVTEAAMEDRKSEGYF